MNLSTFEDVIKSHAFWEAWLVSDLAIAQLLEQVEKKRLNPDVLAPGAPEAERIFCDARDRAETLLPTRKHGLTMHLHFLALMVYDPKWLENLIAGIERDKEAANGSDMPLAQANSISPREEVVGMMLSANGNSISRQPRSLPRGIFGKLDQANIWDYSATQTDDIVLSIVVKAGWFTTTKGANRSTVYHATSRFSEAAEGVAAFAAPKKADFQSVTSPTTAKLKVSLAVEPWDVTEVEEEKK